MARSPEQIQRRKWQRRLVKGLVVGGLALGVPALANRFMQSKERRFLGAAWGETHRYLWELGEVLYHRLGPEGGERAPVVAIHSFGPGSDSLEWRQAAASLARHREVFAPDLFGWGRSAKPPVTYDGPLYVRLLVDFLEHVVARPAILVASGLTASHAVRAAAERGDRVAALGLICPSGLRGRLDTPPWDDLVNRLVDVPVLGTSALYVATSRSAIARHLRHDVYHAPERVDAALVEHHWRASHQPGAHNAFSAYLSGDLRLEDGVEADLERLEVPTWIAWGRHATAPPVEMADLWLRRLDGVSDLEIFEASGLLPHREEPDRFADRLRRFVDAL